jgi:hypothetical protein
MRHRETPFRCEPRRRCCSLLPRLFAAAMLGVLLASRAAVGVDLDPLDALRSRRASLGPLLERGASGEIRPVLRVAVPGSAAARVARDGSYRVEGVSTLPSERVELRAEIGGAIEPADVVGVELGSQLFVSPPVAIVGVRALADVRLDASPPLWNLSLTDVGGRTKLDLPGTGIPGAVRLRASTDRGVAIDALLGAFENAAISLETSTSAITLTPDRRVVSSANGLGWLRLFADGSAAALLVETDIDADVDGDRMRDVWEREFGLDPNLDDAGDDADGDGVTNLAEHDAGTRPDRVDSDGDTLGDHEELVDHGTDPLNRDTDGDFSPDDIEILNGSDPFDPNSRPGTPFTPSVRLTRTLDRSIGTRVELTPDHLAFFLRADGAIECHSFEPLNPLAFFSDDLAISVESVALTVSSTSVGRRVFVASNTAGIHCVDARDPSRLVLAQTIVGLGVVRDIAAVGDLVYAATTRGLEVYRVRSDTGLLERLSTLAVGSSHVLTATGTIVAIGQLGSNTVILVDVSDPTRPVRRGVAVLEASIAPLADLASTYGAVFVAHGPRGVVAISTHDVDAPLVVQKTETDVPGRDIRRIALLGDRLAAYAQGAVARVLDFEIIDGARLVRRTDLSVGVSQVVDLALAQNLLVVTSGPSYSATTVLRDPDTGTRGPSGRVFVEDLASAAAAGTPIGIRATARDDIYTERVELIEDDGTVYADHVPPFDFRIVPPLRQQMPYLFEVRLRGFDLRGNAGELGTATLIVDRDLDGDGLPDSRDSDRDGDGLSDIEELFPGADGYVSDPENADTDGDGIPDGEEAELGADGFVTDPSLRDGDGDGVEDPYEIAVLGTNPSVADTDGDGVADGDEDDDADGLTASGEAFYGTDPRRPDTDGDRLADGLEVELGLDPLRVDSDGDGVGDADEDSDADGLPNRQEIVLGTNPALADSDGDGLDDATEIEVGTAPALATDFSTREIRIRNRSVVLGGPLRVRSLILENATLRVESAWGGIVETLEVTAAEDLSLDARSRIDADARGYRGGNRPGRYGVAAYLGEAPEDLEPSAIHSGGSHGGLGGRGLLGGSDSGRSYDSLGRPALAGSGGSADVDGGEGGHGGGVIVLRARRITIDGNVSALGEDAPVGSIGGGGGAGGSVSIEAETILGAGAVRAAGGLGRGAGGGGGGGRIRIASSDGLALFDRLRISATGAPRSEGGVTRSSNGGAGTIVIAPRDGSLPIVIVDNNGLAVEGSTTPLPGLGARRVLDVGPDWVVVDGAPPRADEVAGLFLDPDEEDGDPTALRIVGVDGPRVLVDGSLQGRASQGGICRGVLRLDRCVVRSAASMELSDRLELASAVDPLVISNAELVAATIGCRLARELVLVDATLFVESLEPAVGAFDTLHLLRSTLGALGESEVGELTLEQSTFIAGAELRAESIVAKGSVLTSPLPALGIPRQLSIAVERTIEIDASSRIDARGRGHLGGLARGNPYSFGDSPISELSTHTGAGGSHGGQGGDGNESGTATAIHGTYREGRTAGGGGNAALLAEPNETGAEIVGVGGNGGGAIVLRAMTARIDGSIDASGAAAAEGAGGGAGGGIELRAGTVLGAGSIIARGGDSTSSASSGESGGGGGGRIVVVSEDRSGFIGSLDVAGGVIVPDVVPGSPRRGAPGTIFFASTDEDPGELRVDGRGRAPRSYRTRIEGTVETRLDRLLIRGGAWVDAGVVLTIDRLDDATIGRFGVEGALRVGRLVAPRINILEVSDGEIDFEEIEAGAAGVGTWKLVRSRAVLRGPMRGESIELASSIITVPESSTERIWPLEVTASGVIFLDSSSAIDASERGYPGGMQGGLTTERGLGADAVVFAVGGRTGGSHGGLGGYQGTGAGLGTDVQPTHDSYADPRFPGGGGSGRIASGERGGNGGGVVRISAGSIHLFGSIRANGEGMLQSDGPAFGGGGAGGAIRVDAGSLTGSGALRANGGAGDGRVGAGGGGGGRIAMHIGDTTAFSGSVEARGGDLVPFAARPDSTGGAGTVLWRRASEAYGELIVENGGRTQSFARTRLRPVGAGTIRALGPTSIRTSQGLSTSDSRLSGQWVILAGKLDRAFRIDSNTLSELTTDEDYGDPRTAAAVGDVYRGAIVLDRLRVFGGGAFDVRDDLIVVVDSAFIAADGILVAPPIVEW